MQFITISNNQIIGNLKLNIANFFFSGCSQVFWNFSTVIHKLMLVQRTIILTFHFFTSRNIITI